MAKLVYGLNVSLDGYVDHDAFAPGPLLFRHWIAQAAAQPDVLYGRKLYELMQYWDGDEWDRDDPAETPDLRAFAEAWRRQHKWVVSRTLKTVGPNATLISGDVEAAVRKLKAERAGDIGYLHARDLEQSTRDFEACFADQFAEGGALCLQSAVQRSRLH